MKIAQGLNVLELGSIERRMHPTLIWDDENVVLIDAGLPGQLEDIRGEMEKAGVPFEKINKVIITHHDLDHIGGLAGLVKKSQNPIEVLAHEGEKPYIEGDKRPIKLTSERLASMSEEERNDMLNKIATLKTKVNRAIEDDDELPYCGGIKVIHTPGHTPGHTCLYLKKYKALVTGDALNVVNGELVGPKPEYTYDMKQGIESLKKLVSFDIETVICYHGGVFKERPNERITFIANS